MKPSELRALIPARAPSAALRVDERQLNLGQGARDTTSDQPEQFAALRGVEPGLELNVQGKQEVVGPNGRTREPTVTPEGQGGIELGGATDMFGPALISRGGPVRLLGMLTGTLFDGTSHRSIGFAFGSGAVSRANYPDTNYSTLPVAATGVSAALGGTGGTPRNFDCPADYAASGIVYTYENDVVGNFGLVCERFQQPLGVGDVPVSHSFTGSVVLAGGSIDTNFHVANRENYNIYRHEVLEGPTAASVQYSQLCPPGSYLSGLSAQADHLMRSLIAIECRETVAPTATSAAVQRSARLPLITNVSTAPLLDTVCGTNALVTGLRSRSAYFTDGLGFACSTLYGPVFVPRIPPWG